MSNLSWINNLLGLGQSSDALIGAPGSSSALGAIGDALGIGGGSSSPVPDSTPTTATPDGSGGFLSSAGSILGTLGNVIGGNGDTTANAGGMTGAIQSIIQGLSPAVRTALAPYLANQDSGGLLAAAKQNLSNAGKNIANVATPDFTKLIPTLHQQIMNGEMTPAQATAVLQSMQGTLTPAQMQAAQTGGASKANAASANVTHQVDSNLNNVNSDAQSLANQRNALDQLHDIATNGGLSEADKERFAATMQQANANAAQQRQGQIQSLEMQGNGGSGAELAARLAGTQSTANSNAAAGADLNQQAQLRALTALQQGLTGNSNLNNQLFTQDSNKAAAQDAINQFNTTASNTLNSNNANLANNTNLANMNAENQFKIADTSNNQQANATNAAAANTANQGNFNTANQIAANNANNQQQANVYNATNEQNANNANFNTANTIGAKNTDIANNQAMLPWNAAQQTQQDELQKQIAASNAQVGAGKAQAQLGDQQIARTGQYVAGAAPAPASGGSKSNDQTGNIIKGIATVAPYLMSMFSDEKLKTDKSELTSSECDDMMGKLTGYKYRYKNKDQQNEMTAGIMAQDVEKIPGLNNSVIDTPAGKMLSGNELMGKALAVLANQHDRLKKLEGNK